MALSANVNYDAEGQTEHIALKAEAASYTLYKGAIVNIKANGLAGKATDTAGETPVGVATEKTILAGASAETIVVEVGKLWIAKSDAAQTDVGEPIYATADDTVTTTVGTNTRILGLCVGFRTGYVLVDTRIKGLQADTDT